MVDQGMIGHRTPDGSVTVGRFVNLRRRMCRVRSSAARPTIPDQTSRLTLAEPFGRLRDRPICRRVAMCVRPAFRRPPILLNRSPFAGPDREGQP